jgi:hypothetical protein
MKDQVEQIEHAFADAIKAMNALPPETQTEAAAGLIQKAARILAGFIVFAVRGNPIAMNEVLEGTTSYMFDEAAACRKFVETIHNQGE